MRSAFLGIALAVLLAAPARADILAVAPVAAPGRADSDVGLIDASTGASLPLPAGVNTAADENHPSISTDGRRLAFERRDQGGIDRLIVADLVSGQTMDLFNAFDTATLHPTSPAISADGDWVTTGSEGTGLYGRGLFDFPNSVSSSTREPILPGSELLDPTRTEPGDHGPFAYRRKIPQPGTIARSEILVEQVPGADGALTATSSAFSAAHPSIAVSAGHETLVYDIRTVDSSGNHGPGDIGFCVLFLHNGKPCGLGQGLLPPLVSSARNETRPAFTPDGRYIGFIRDEADGRGRLYVFDTETQTLIDPGGTDLGEALTFDLGNLNLYEQPVLKVSSLPQFGAVVVTPVRRTPIGLLVQRAVGHHRLLGRRVPTLKPAGRIPLGIFRRGRHVIHWRAHLRPGRYQFTPRAVTKTGRIRDLGRPRIFRVRPPHS